MRQSLVCGIDLGGKTRKTTGVCLLKVVKGQIKFDQRRCRHCQTVFGRDLLSYLKPHLKKIEIIAIDAPLTLGPGKGKMRLWEKFFSTKPFRRHKVNPIPPAAVWRLSYHGMEIVSQLSDYGFSLDKNLLEVFSTFAKKILKRIPRTSCKTQDERDAFLCAYIAAHHLNGETFWLGYKDGKLFLPSFSFWRKIWFERFKKNFQERDRFRYKFLTMGGKTWV